MVTCSCVRVFQCTYVPLFVCSNVPESMRPYVLMFHGEVIANTLEILFQELLLELKDVILKIDH